MHSILHKLRLRAALVACCVAAVPALAQGIATLDAPAGQQFGDFLVARRPHLGSIDAPEPPFQRVNLFYRTQLYRPFGAYDVNQVRPVGQGLVSRQAVANDPAAWTPWMIATTLDETGVGTVLIGEQNGTPLSRILSPIKNARDPDWGLPQHKREDVLLFPVSNRALVVSSGEILWFEPRSDLRNSYHPCMLVSVSPDNKSGAFLSTKDIVVASQQGPQAAATLTQTLQNVDLRAVFDDAYAQARKAIKENTPRTDSTRWQRELKVKWFGENFRWISTPRGWQVTGKGLTTAPVTPES